MELPQFIRENILDIADLKENINISHNIYTCFSSYNIDNFFFLSDFNKKMLNSFTECKIDFFYNDNIVNSNQIKLDDKLIQFIVPCNIDYKENLFLSKDVILCVSSSKVKELVSDLSINNYLFNKKIFFTDNINLMDLSDISLINNDIYTFNTYNNFIIRVNHLLYLIDNSNLSFIDKKHYKYYVLKYANIDVNDMWQLYESEDKLKKIALEIEKKIDKKMLKEITCDFNKLDNKGKLKKLSLQDFSLDIFLNKFNNINEISSLDILKKYYKLDKREKNIIFYDDFILKNLYSLFNDSNFNIPYFEEIISYVLNSSELLFLYNNKDKYIGELNFKFNEDNFFKILFKQDINLTINILLDRNDKLKDFLVNISKYDFRKIDYSILVKLLKVIEKNKFDCDFEFINTSISLEFQYRLLDEGFSDNFIINIINNCSNEVQQYFYLNDNRFSYLFSKFDVVTLSNNNYLFQESVLENQEFFNLFLSNSIIQSRLNINKLMEHNTKYYFEIMLDKYEDNLINEFDSELELFYEYKMLIDNICMLDELNFKNNKTNFLFDYDIINEIRKYTYYDENKIIHIKDNEALYNYLKKLSKLKLNELIVDRLFDDDIYNVLLNIKEMLRYHTSLGDDEYVLNLDKSNFYNIILNLDNMNSTNVLDFYKKYRNKNNSFMFYQDLRKTKDICYDKINDKLFKTSNISSLPDKVKSSRYGINIYDYTSMEYIMLVRCLFGEYEEESSNKRDCYTLLSQDNNYVIDDDCYVYGYNLFDKNYILHVFEGDAFSGDVINSSLDVGSYWVNRIMTCDEIILSSDCYSEIQIINKTKNRKKHLFNSLKPSYLITYNDVSEKVLNEAKRLNIPIFIINKNLNTDKLMIGNFDEVLDQYSKNHDMELELIRRRKR